MSTDMDTHASRYQELMAGFRDLNDAQPAAMDGFGRLHRSALADDALSRKHKELMALAIAVVQRCGDCVTIHAHDAVHAGATEAEIAESVAVAVLMGGGPAAVYGQRARAAAAEFAAAPARG